MGGGEIVLVFVLVGAAVLVGWVLTLSFKRRELQHRETLAAIEKGAPPPDLGRRDGVGAPRVYLLKGLIWLYAGLAMTVFLAAFWSTSWDRQPMTDRVREAEELRLLGYSSEEIKGLILPNTGPTPDFPLGLCLVGLVPVGVGLAYLSFYRAEIRNASKGQP